MVISAASGDSSYLDGREAGQAAALKAVKALGMVQPGLVILLIAEDMNPSAVTAGVLNITGSIPIWGLGSPRLISPDCGSPKVVVFIFGGGLDVRTRMAPEFVRDPIGSSLDLVRNLPAIEEFPAVLLAADGVQGDLNALCATLETLPVTVAGALTGGPALQVRTLQITDAMAVSGGLAALSLGSGLKLAVGWGHGWKEVGLQYRITRATGNWINLLDGISPAKLYEGIFGQPARLWAHHPLNDLVRLYPLGVKDEKSGRITIHAPLHVEVDGSFRLNIPAAEGQIARLMSADQDACLAAVRIAAQTAIRDLDGADPLAGLVLIDRAWFSLFETHMNSWVDTLNAEVSGIPWTGVFTNGLLVRPDLHAAPEALNQQFGVVLIGAVNKA